MDGLHEAHEISSRLAETSSAICSSSATEIIRLCGLLNEHYTLQCAVFMVAYFLANACTVRLYVVESTGAAEDGVHDEAFEEALGLLREMAGTWPVAQRALQSVQRLAADLEKNRRRTSPPDETSAQNGCPLVPQDWTGSWLSMSQPDEWTFTGGFWPPAGAPYYL